MLNRIILYDTQRKHIPEGSGTEASTEWQCIWKFAFHYNYKEKQLVLIRERDKLLQLQKELYIISILNSHHLTDHASTELLKYNIIIC